MNKLLVASLLAAFAAPVQAGIIGLLNAGEKNKVTITVSGANTPKITVQEELGRCELQLFRYSKDEFAKKKIQKNAERNDRPTIVFSLFQNRPCLEALMKASEEELKAFRTGPRTTEFDLNHLFTENTALGQFQAPFMTGAMDIALCFQEFRPGSHENHQRCEVFSVSEASGDGKVIYETNFEPGKKYGDM